MLSTHATAIKTTRVTPWSGPGHWGGEHVAIKSNAQRLAFDLCARHAYYLLESNRRGRRFDP